MKKVQAESPCHKDIKVLLIIFIFSVIINLPFLSQSFHIDDPLNIYLARQVIKSPADPYGFQLVYNGVLQGFYKFYANPPLNGYLLSLGMLLVGEHEVPLHLFYLIYTFFIGIFMYLISQKFLNDPKASVISSVLLLISPAVFVMNHSIMPDIPLLCFYLASIYFFLEAKDRTYLYIAAGIFAALASLTRYTGLTLIPIFLVYSFLCPKYRGPMSLVSSIIPLIIFYFWYESSIVLYTDHYWNQMYAFETGQDKFVRIGMHLLANVVYLGGSSIFPICFFVPALMLRNKDSKLRIIGRSAVIALFFSSLLFMKFGHDLGQAGLVFVFIFSMMTFFSTVLIYIKDWFNSRSQNVVLFFWVLILLVFNSFFLHTAVKYIMLTIPPLILIFVIIVKDLLKEKYPSFLILTIVLTGLLGAGIAIADTKFSNIYRDYAKSLYSTYKKKDNQVFFSGHWGWEYYLKELNAEPVVSLDLNQFKKGDIILVPSIPWPQRLPLTYKNRLKLLNTIPVNSSFPIRIMNGISKAFFYANYNYPEFKGVLPYSFSSTTPLELFYVLEVK